jgi:hypothetical protein
MLVELMMTLEWSMYIIVLEQYRRCAGVLGQNQICLLENTKRTESDILQIAYRCGNNV